MIRHVDAEREGGQSWAASWGKGAAARPPRAQASAAVFSHRH